MCVIIIAERLPERALLERAATLNPDGVGVAYYVGRGRWRIRRGLRLDDVYPAAAREAAEGTQVWHFRAATLGEVHLRNVQPIAIPPSVAESEVVEAWLAHNGHIAGLGTSAESDTRKLAALLARLGDDSEAQAELLGLLGGGRYVIARGGEYRRIGTWHKHEGLWLSNLALSCCGWDNKSSAWPTSSYLERWGPGWLSRRGGR